MPPFFSVIIPSFNRLGLTIDAIESVRAQSLTDYEIIVVDDGSADGTSAALCKRYGSEIRLISKPNGGVSTARNVGASHATGEFIAYLDSDDLWTPDKLQVFHEAICTREIGKPAFYFSDFRRYEMTTSTYYPKSNTELYPRLFNHFQREQGNIYTAAPFESFKCVLNDYPFFPSTFVLSRSIHDHIRWDPGVRFSEDFNFVCKVCDLYPLIYLDSKLSIIRMHTTNKSGNTAAKRASHFATLQAAEARFSSTPEKWREVRIAAGRKHFAAAKDLYRSQEWTASAKHLANCLPNPHYIANIVHSTFRRPSPAASRAAHGSDETNPKSESI